jgi:hypothetical protein
MPEDNQEREAGPALPWAFVLDPAANARALGEVQRRGLSAARELIERVASTVDRRDDPQQPFGWMGTDAGSNGGGPRTPPELVTQFMQAWWELGMNTMTAFLPYWNGSPTNGSSGHQRSESPSAAPVVDVTGETVSALWHLKADPEGSVQLASELWLRNSSPESIGVLRLSVSELRSTSGPTISATELTLDPSSIAELPARSARGVQLKVRLGQRVPAGTFRGVLHCEGGADLRIPIELEMS